MALRPEFKKYAEECQDELKKLICDIAVIPAPSHHEEKRVAFVKEWMENNGAKDVYVDDALNVVWPVNVTDSNDVFVIMAHTDIVFPESVELKVTEKDGKFYCPGISDDTARLGVLLMTARYYVQNNISPKCGILFVANSCEEGLGNLKGSRKIVADYGDRIKYFASIDSGLGAIVNLPVGSHRYKVTVKTEGGHSYSAFGNRNAIHVMSSLISSLYTVNVPKVGESKTTYNVGGITGGTSVNTIAQSCEMLYEYRSTSRDCLRQMKECFEKMVEAYRATGVEIEVELIGDRPCMGDVDMAEEEKLVEMARAAYKDAGYEARTVSGSTDSNAPLGAGIPAITIGSCISAGAHTLNEWCDIASLKPGMEFILQFVSNFFDF